MKCNRCGNEVEDFFYFKNGIYYCRLCTQFIGKISNLSSKITPVVSRANINYHLSDEQKEIAKEIFNERNEIYVKAVCGAGKTECVFSSIEKALQEGKRVGYATPRKEIVVEIYNRLKEVFGNVKITCVYGGHSKDLEGDIIVFTTHQSYRYKKAFGLLIIDEYDAFPFKGNLALLNLTKQTSISKIIYLSATFSDDDIRNNKKVIMNKRFHKIKIPSPIFKRSNLFLSLYFLLTFIRKMDTNYTLLIFVPTIKYGNYLLKFLKIFHINSLFINSNSVNKKALLKEIKEKITNVVITSTILERGITIEAVHIIVMSASHIVFNKETLIQISGRAGRKSKYPAGEVFFLSKKKTPNIINAINEISTSNHLI